MIPIEFRSQAEFDALRSYLEGAGFEEKAVLDRREIENFAEIENRLRSEPTIAEPVDNLDLLIFIFLEGGSAKRSRVEQMLGSDFLSLLERFHLITEDPLRPEFIASTVVLAPVMGIYCISDRWWAPGGEEAKPPVDAVYPASAPNTVRFLQLMPKHRCEAFLDLCCGTAIAALVAARNFATHAYAYDLAERSTTFAEFNRRLNGIENCTIGTGDLYEPAGDQTFDYITAHPPYVPVLKPKFVFHDGGEDGELILKRVIKEAPKYLQPGGVLYTQSMATDRKSAPYERRIREWLGSAEGEFDVAFFLRHETDPAHFAMRSLMRGTGDRADAMQWKSLFEELQIRSLVYGITAIQCHDSPRTPFTLRRNFSQSTGQKEIEMALRWETLQGKGAATPLVLECPLRPQPAVRLSVSHQLGEDGWEETDHTIRTSYPFVMEYMTEPWIPYLLSRCDGKRTGLDHLKHLEEQGIVKPGTAPQEFAQALLLLVSGGFLCPPIPN